MNNTETKLLATNVVIAKLKANKNEAERETLLEEQGFTKFAPKTHMEGEEVIIIHYGTGGAGSGQHTVASTTSKDQIDYYRKSTDIKGAVFYKRN